MYYGISSHKLLELRDKYEELFGYDPNGDMEYEFDNYDEYIQLLNSCIEQKKICIKYWKNSTNEWELRKIDQV